MGRKFPEFSKNKTLIIAAIAITPAIRYRGREGTKEMNNVKLAGIKIGHLNIMRDETIMSMDLTAK